MHSEFWRQAFQIGCSVYNDKLIDNVDEQAGPAYFATSGLSRWLFWRRLKWATREIDRTASNSAHQVALDFGCGFGLMLPHLRSHYSRTVGIDLFPSLAQEFMLRWDKSPQAKNMSTETAHELTIVDHLEKSQLAPGSVDLIVALDVLEHFESLDEIVDQLTSLLKPDGKLLVSGPTETWLYKLGRRMVGFSGDYHHQTIYDVHAALARKCSIDSMASLPPCIPLFLLSKWQR